MPTSTLDPGRVSIGASFLEKAMGPQRFFVLLTGIFFLDAYLLVFHQHALVNGITVDWFKSHIDVHNVILAVGLFSATFAVAIPALTLVVDHLDLWLLQTLRFKVRDTYRSWRGQEHHTPDPSPWLKKDYIHITELRRLAVHRNDTVAFQLCQAVVDKNRKQNSAKMICRAIILFALIAWCNDSADHPALARFLIERLQEEQVWYFQFTLTLFTLFLALQISCAFWPVNEADGYVYLPEYPPNDCHVSD